MTVIVAGRAAQFILLFLTLKVSTTLLAPAEMARVYLVSSIVALFSMFLINPVGMFVNRRIHAWNKVGTIRANYRYFWVYLLVITGIAYLTLRMFADRGWLQLSGSTLLIALIAVYLLTQTINQMVIPGLNLLDHRVWFVILTVATASAALVSAVLLVKIFKPKAEYWIAGLTVGQLFCSGLGWKVFFSKTNNRVTWRALSRAQLLGLATFAVPISASVGLNWVQTQSYRFLMERTLGLNLLGIFAAGYGVSAGIISAFEAVFTTYLQPIFYRRVAGDDLAEQSDAWCEYAQSIIPSLVLVGFFILAIRQELTKILLGTAFQQASRYVGWGVVPEVARVAGAVYGMIAHARMKTTLLLLPSVLGAFAAVVLMILLIPRWGAKGVGVALLLAGATSYGCTYVVTWNVFRRNIALGPVIRSVLMGVVILISSKAMRQFIGINETTLLALVIVLVVGGAFAAGQYVLLRPLLSKG